MEGERARTPEEKQQEFNKLPENEQKILREEAFEEAMIAKTKRTREASDIAILNLSEQEIDELNVPENERDEKFFETVKKVWPRINKFAVHTNNEYITPLYKGSDLDGETCIKILEKTRKKIIRAGDNQNIWFVKKGESMEGAYNFDTGNVGGTRVKVDEKTGTVTIHSDHHDSEIRNDTCAAKLMYEDLTYLRVLEKDKKFEKYLDFVTQIDNRTFPLDKEKLKYYHKTLFGLAEFVKPNEIIKFFKEGRDPAELLTDEQINKLDPQAGKRMKDGKFIEGKDLIDRSRNLEKNAKKSVERLEQMKEERLIIDAPGYGGKIVVDISENGHKTVPCGFDAVRAYGYKAYVSWNPDKKSFFIDTADDFKPGHQFEQEGMLDMRGRHMLMKPEKSTQPLTITLEKIISTLTDGNFEAKGKLKEYLDKEKGSQEKIKQQELEVPKKEQLDKEKQEAERLAKEKAIAYLSTPENIQAIDKGKNLEEIKAAFYEVTKKDLIKERDKKVEEILGLKHKKIIKAGDMGEYRQWIIKKNIRKEGEKILQDNNSKALDILGRIDPDIKKENREKYLSDLKNKLGLKNVRGGNIVLDKLINDGYKIEKGWFGRRKMYKMENGKKSFFDAKKDFGKMFQEIKSEIASKAQETADLKIKAGRQFLKNEKLDCTKLVIQKAVMDHSLEEQQKQEAELQPSIERQEIAKKEIELAKEEEKKYEEERIELLKEKEELEREIKNKPGEHLIEVIPGRKIISPEDIKARREIRERPIEKKEKTEPSGKPESKEPKSFEDLIDEGKKLIERFKNTTPSRRNLDKFKEVLFLLDEEFIEPKNREDERKFREWKKDVLETIRRLSKKKSDKPETKSPEQDETGNTSESGETQKEVMSKESIEPVKEEPVKPKSSEELLLEYATVRKKWNRAKGKEKKELKKHMEDLNEQRKKAREK